GRPLPPAVSRTRRTVDAALGRAGFSSVDATGRITGRDLLQKVWEFTVACPLGVAIVHEGISDSTLANIYYELGLMQAYGHETVVVKIGKPLLPSDFVRTEYIPAGRGLPVRLDRFLSGIA